MTEREKQLAKREGFAKGVWAAHYAQIGCRRAKRDDALYAWSDSGPLLKVGEISVAAVKEYPLPQIRRPRVVADPEEGFSQQWRVVDGTIEFKSGPDYWRWEKATFATGLPGGCMTPTNARIRMWAKLLEEPFELVDDDGGAAHE